MAAGEMSESFARTVCTWTDRLRAESRDDADAVLVAAARTGADLALLAELAAEIYSRSLPPDDDGEDAAFEDRAVKLQTTFQGAGVLAGGWTLVLNPDGTTTAWSPDRSKVLHSHGAPGDPG
jgi:hypothetical protein